MRTPRITAGDAGDVTTIYAPAGGRITASVRTRTLGGPVARYGIPGRTSAGKLRVRPGALRFPARLSDVKLTLEHQRDQSRGHLVAVEDNGVEIRASLRVSDGPLGDAALGEAVDHTRDGLSFDVIDARIEGDEIVDALVIAIGQVGIPAYDDLRIDSIAASQAAQQSQPNPPSTTTQEGSTMTEEQRQRLIALRAQQTRSDAEQSELSQLEQLAAGTQPATQQPAQPATPPAQPAPPAGAAPAGQEPGAGSPQPAPGAGVQAAAHFAAVPAGVPAPTTSGTQVRASALDHFVNTIVDALAGGGGAQAITAALNDVTSTAHSSVIEAPAWSGELWSGLQYEPQFTDLFSSGSLTSFEGNGWRFTSKLEIKDYAGDKVAIPTSQVTTEPSSYEAARMAVGVDVDRKFYDFPNAAFLRGLVEQVRESWAMKLDAKVLAYMIAQAVPVEGGVGVETQPTLLKAAAVAVRALKRRKVGQAGWVLVNDEDMFTLLDLAEKDVPAFLKLFRIDPNNFRSSQDVPQGKVLAGVRQAATLRTLPGSPIRVSAQHIANGGIDEAWFGYWAMEEHHTAGIASSTFTEPVAP